MKMSLLCLKMNLQEETHLRTQTRSDTEAKGNSEMVYSFYDTRLQRIVVVVFIILDWM